VAQIVQRVRPDYYAKRAAAAQPVVVPAQAQVTTEK
jgi:hypothetical protein